MKTLLILIGIFLTNCGTEEVIETTTSEEEAIVWEAEEPDTITILMCQQAIACSENGTCIDTTKELDFELDTSMYYQACFNFRPCDGKNIYTEQQISDYKELNCG